MPTTVVNIRHEAYDQYVGRAGKGHDGIFGNPFRVQEHGSAALTMYAEYFHNRVETDEAFKKAVLALKDQRLGCFCRPKSGFRGKVRCHAAYIAAWLDGIPPEDVP